jgi:pimeloyl-ACP methyl ester carboxylesterase
MAEYGVASEHVPYDEFGLFHENAHEYGLPYDGPPVVRRVHAPLGDGRQLSALVWGNGAPELLLVHGGAQNAHTWDTVAMALGRPLVTADLPGHGHSDGPGARPEGQLAVDGNADDLAGLLQHLGAGPLHVVGMSLGGLSSIALTALHPRLVRSLTLVDITPGVNQQKTQAITAFVNGPATFASFDDLLARTIEHNPTRTEASLRRGILHNAVQQPDGSWVWRYRRHAGETPIPTEPGVQAPPDYGVLWDRLGSVQVPVMLARGMLPQSVIDDDDEAELRRRLPNARVEHFANAGHSIQGDMPVELAAAIADFVA